MPRIPMVNMQCTWFGKFPMHAVYKSQVRFRMLIVTKKTHHDSRFLSKLITVLGVPTQSKCTIGVGTRVDSSLSMKS